MAMITIDDPCKNLPVEDTMNNITNIVLQTLIILFVSQTLYLFLRPLGQPLSIAQLLAGMVIGSSGLSRIPMFKAFMFPGDNLGSIEIMSVAGRTIFMFLIGLELDIQYLRRTRFLPVVITLGGSLACAILAAMFSHLVYWQTGAHGSRSLFTVILMLVLSNTASPILVRMATELKVATTELGRVAISAAVINDMGCLFILAFIDVMMVKNLQSNRATVILKLMMAICVVGLIAVASRASRPMIRWLNRRHQKRKDLKMAELGTILVFVGSVAMLTELLGYNSMIPCFILGAVFPREGRVVRTLTAKLTGPVHNLILPIYFGSTGIEADIWLVGESKRLLAATITLVVLSTIGKVLGTLAAARYFKMSVSEGLVLGFLLNVKGHVDILLIDTARSFGIWQRKASSVMILAVVLNTIIIGPIVAAIIRRERKALAYQYSGLESHKPDTELRMLACVHGPHDLPMIINLLEASRGTDRFPLTAYVMHLVELTSTVSANMFYHQKNDEEDHQYEDYGGEDERHINNAIDSFTNESGISIRQLIAVSAFSNMHQDVCNGLEDVRASIVILPFHRHQRVDGKMEDGKEGHRLTNQNVLNKAKCTVGILVDRGLGGNTQLSATHASHHVATLFFGGADDREALAYGGRIAEHPSVSLTVIRFLPMSTRDYETGIGMESAKDDEVLMSISNHDKENDVDGAFLSSFYNRYVLNGIVSYVEKFVENGAETVNTLGAMDGMFSLYIVGKGGRGLSPLTMGISNWIEFPELGVIGDLLASSDFTVNGSVLVIQQYNPTNKDLIDVDFDVVQQ